MLRPVTDPELTMENVSAQASGALQLSQPFKSEAATIGAAFRALQFHHSDFPSNVMSPFVMVDHFEMWGPTFDVHPHAGMSAVTLVFEDTKGLMKSIDSVGHHSSFGAGDLHWTLAGRGILHTQLPADDAHIHALQIFVNLPASLKSLSPDSFKVAAADMPTIAGRGLRLRVVAGDYGGQKSPARPPEPLLMLDGYLEAAHDPLSIPIPADWNAWIHVVEGQLEVGDAAELNAGEAICASALSVSQGLSLLTSTAAHFVVLAGRRIDEPVIQHGPFVFESEASLTRAMADLRAGRFGEVDAFS